MPTPTSPLPPGASDIARAIASSVTDYATAVEVLRGRFAHDWTDVIPPDMRDMYEHCWAAAFVDCVMGLAAPAPLPTVALPFYGDEDDDRPRPGDRVRVVVDCQFRGEEGIFLEWGPFTHSVLLDRSVRDGHGGIRFFRSEDLEWLVDADAHSCANCGGDDPDTCLFNGAKEA